MEIKNRSVMGNLMPKRIFLRQETYMAVCNLSIIMSDPNEKKCKCWIPCGSLWSQNTNTKTCIITKRQIWWQEELRIWNCGKVKFNYMKDPKPMRIEPWVSVSWRSTSDVQKRKSEDGCIISVRGRDIMLVSDDNIIKIEGDATYEISAWWQRSSWLGN